MKARFYRMTPAQKQEIEKQVKDLLKAGVIERSTSDWLSPVVLAKKANGTFRLTVDLRALNRIVKPIYFPLPRHEDVTDALGESQASVFSTIDLAQAFLQVPLDESTKHKTRFITHQGVFQFRRLPYGLSQSPAVFSSIMAHVLRDFNYMFALVYADDILIFSRSPREHLEHLSQVFAKLREANLRLRPEKCHFAKAKILFLGHIVSKEGITVNPEKTAAITTFPVPKTVTEVRAYLGLCQYYRRFVKNFSNIAAPLNNLLKKKQGTKKNTPIEWTPQCQEAFDSLKGKLTSTPILALPDFSKEFILYCDASSVALGFILGQRDSAGREAVVAYGGRGLREAEKKWPITQLEALAIVEGIRHYQVYLGDRHFTVVTDHACLQFLQNTKLSNARLCRWALYLQQYRYSIVYKKGARNTNVDPLSRRDYAAPPEKPDDLLLPIKETTEFTVIVNSLTTVPESKPDTLQENTPAEAKYAQLSSLRHLEHVMSIQDKTVHQHQVDDPDLSKVISYLEREEIPENLDTKQLQRFIAESHDYIIDPDDNLLYHLYTPRGKGLKADCIVKQLVVPDALKHDIMVSYHDSLLAGHQGFDRTYHLIRLKYYWPRMYSQIKQYVASCKMCQLNKRDSHPKKVPLKPLPCHGPFQRLHVDLYGPLPEVNGYKYAVLFCDAFTGWPEIFPVKTLTGKEIATILYNEIICRYGAPRSLLSDRGTNFLSSIVTEVCKIFQIVKLKTSSWHPETNATAERRMSTIGQTLRMYIDKNQKNWPDILPSIMASLRATPSVNSSLFSPYKLLTGEDMRLPIDTALIPVDKLPKNVLDHLQEITSQFEVTRDLAKQNIKAAQERNKRYHDRGAAKPTFYIGQQVVINNVNKTKGLNPKLQAKKVGPYYISDVNEDNNTYLLRDCQTHKELRSRIHAKRLTAFVDANTRDIKPPNDIDSTSETDEDVQGNHQQAAANSRDNQTPNPPSPSQHPPNQTQLAPQTDITRTQSDTL